MANVRTVKTAAGAMVVQIVHSSHGGVEGRREPQLRPDVWLDDDTIVYGIPRDDSRG